MSRCTLATLTVDRPAYGHNIDLTTSWLRARAEEIESEPNCFTTGVYTSRRMSAADTDRTMAKLRVRSLGHLSLPTRRRIAKWLRSRAQYLSKHAHVAQTSRRGWFRQDFAL